MAGHSKWANIQHRKNAQDAKRGKIFTKLIREITVSARHGGPLPESNPRLRLALDKAYGQNMSKDTVERAIKRGAGGLDDAQVEEIRYEGYGPAGVAVLVECLTDNRNRTVGEVRFAFSKCGGNLGTDGSVAYLFKKVGLLGFAPGVSEDKVLECALEGGAEDVAVQDDGSLEVFTDPKDFETVKAYLESHKLKPAFSEVTYKAMTVAEIGQEETEKIERLIELLEDLDDVQNVYTNWAG